MKILEAIQQIVENAILCSEDSKNKDSHEPVITMSNDTCLELSSLLLDPENGLDGWSEDYNDYFFVEKETYRNMDTTWALEAYRAGVSDRPLNLDILQRMCDVKFSSDLLNMPGFIHRDIRLEIYSWMGKSYIKSNARPLAIKVEINNELPFKKALFDIRPVKAN